MLIEIGLYYSNMNLYDSDHGIDFSFVLYHAAHWQDSLYIV